MFYRNIVQNVLLVLSLIQVLRPNQAEETLGNVQAVEENPSALLFAYDKNLNCIRGCGAVDELGIDCNEVFDEKHQNSGIYLLKSSIGDSKPYGVFCINNAGKNWTVIQRREDGTQNFYRNWEDYKNGFGLLNGEYWLGLERIHALTSQRKYELWIEMITFDDEVRSAWYTEFSVASEAEGYKLIIGDFSGDASVDKMQHNKGSKFTTLDKDNDNWPGGNCAIDREGAWWYNGCTFCNLNGVYKRNDDRKGIYCGEWNEPFKYVHMAIRRL